MTSIFEYISYGELIRLIVCLTIDGIEYVTSILLFPFVGDIYAIIALAASLYMFGRLGLFSALDLIPGLDLLPINTITWLIWMLSRRRKDITNMIGHDRVTRALRMETASI